MIGSFAEVVSLGSIFPFISIITQPDKAFDLPFMAYVIDTLGIKAGGDLVVPITILFALASMIAGLLRLLLVWYGAKFGNATGADLSVKVFRQTLYQPYKAHLTRNSSEVISVMTQKANIATGFLLAVVSLGMSAVMFLSIMLTLFVIDPIVTIISVVIFGFSYLVIASLTRHIVARNSVRLALEQSKLIKLIQEGLGGIRDILLDGSQEVYCKAYSNSITPLQQGTSQNTFIVAAPRYVMETLSMVLIAILVLAIRYQSGNTTTILPLLGILALVAQRSLPLMQQIYGGWSSMVGSRAALSDVLDLLDQPLPIHATQLEPKPLTLNENISFQSICFRYSSNTPWVLQDVNLTIPKGSRVGVMGITGSGKSTLLDLLMGLLEPTQGQILVDEKPLRLEHQRAWQRAVAHVPQSIFLADTTIAENIAFGIQPEKIDLNRVRMAAQQARIAEFIESRPDSYNASIGERGVRLSGGQRQRIGIARALYKQASVLVFDEATSALDDETEKEVMQAIESLSQSITIFIIAHRLSTLKNCTQILELGEGQIKRIGTYNQIVDLTA
jgi:ATP-binding cassette subfamily B protein